MNDKTKVLSLYDFASKQAYIYRTSKIKEISGASALLSGMYRKFVNVLKKNNIILEYDVAKTFSVNDFDNNSTIDGEVLYDGGGNLMVLWKSFEIYKEANKTLSAYLLENAPGVSLIAAYVEYRGVFDDRKDSDGRIIEEGDRTRLYRENTRRKNRFPAYELPAVSPFTQVDPMTFLPVTYKRSAGTRNSVYPAAECSLSSDRYYKARAYENRGDDLNELEEGMLAVIYIDGNSMGKKLIKVKSDDYDTGVKNLRDFSKQVNNNYIVEPVQRIRKAGFAFRQVIGGGDEITLICRAEDAFEIMELYFSVLREEKITFINDKESFDCTSCAGISVFHAKSPFNVAYDIAEACCEFAKKKAHEKDGNYLCFYFCHSGITNAFYVLHKNEQIHASGKPYRIIGNESVENEDSCYSDRDIRILQKKLCVAGRANVKALGSAAQESLIKYQFEVKRVNAYLKDDQNKFDGTEKEMRIVYDMAEFFDLWFAKEEQHVEETDH